MEKIEIIAQIMGILGMAFMISSFQIKKNRTLLITQGIGGFLFFLNYILMGAIVGAGLNIVAIIRAILGSKEKSRNKKTFWILACLYVLMAVIYVVLSLKDGSFNPLLVLWNIILTAAQIVGTWAFWKNDGALIRKANLFCVSPIWLFNNIFITFTIGGILCEVFCLSSIIISLIRFGKDGFEK